MKTSRKNKSGISQSKTTIAGKKQTTKEADKQTDTDRHPRSAPRAKGRGRSVGARATSPASASPDEALSRRPEGGGRRARVSPFIACDLPSRAPATSPFSDALPSTAACFSSLMLSLSISFSHPLSPYSALTHPPSPLSLARSLLSRPLYHFC